MNNRDWQANNELIFAQPSNLRFVRGSPPRHAAIEVYTPRRDGHTVDLVVFVAVLLAVVLGVCVSSG